MVTCASTCCPPVAVSQIQSYRLCRSMPASVVPRYRIPLAPRQPLGDPSVNRGLGLRETRFHHPDPFFIFGRDRAVIFALVLQPGEFELDRVADAGVN